MEVSHPMAPPAMALHLEDITNLTSKAAILAMPCWAVLPGAQPWGALEATWLATTMGNHMEVTG